MNLHDNNIKQPAAAESICTFSIYSLSDLCLGFGLGFVNVNILPQNVYVVNKCVDIFFTIKIILCNKFMRHKQKVSDQLLKQSPSPDLSGVLSSISVLGVVEEHDDGH